MHINFKVMCLQQSPVMKEDTLLCQALLTIYDLKCSV